MVDPAIVRDVCKVVIKLYCDHTRHSFIQEHLASFPGYMQTAKFSLDRHIKVKILPGNEAKKPYNIIMCSNDILPHVIHEKKY